MDFDMPRLDQPGALLAFPERLLIRSPQIRTCPVITQPPDLPYRVNSGFRCPVSTHPHGWALYPILVHRLVILHSGFLHTMLRSIALAFG
jgi:hypothetical protein